MTERKRKRVEEDRMKEEIYKGKEEEEGERRGEEESSSRSNPRGETTDRDQSAASEVAWQPEAARPERQKIFVIGAARCSPAALDHFRLGGETVPK